MTQHSNLMAPPSTQALSRLPMLGPPLLLKGEDARAYNDLLARISGHLDPSDILEEIWVREIVDLSWENLRWRRDLARFLDAALPTVLEEIIRPLLQDQPAAPTRGKSFTAQIRAAGEALVAEQDLVRRWAQGDEEALKQVDDLLASVNLTMDHVAAKAAARELAKIEQFNRLIANTEWRRNATLREVERHRASLAQKLRREIGTIEEAEFKAIAVKPPGLNTGAANAAEAQAAMADVGACNATEPKVGESDAVTVDTEPQAAKAGASVAETDKVSTGDISPADITVAEDGPTEAMAVEDGPYVDGTFEDRSFDDDDGLPDDAVEDDMTGEDDTAVVRIVPVIPGMPLTGATGPAP